MSLFISVSQKTLQFSQQRYRLIFLLALLCLFIMAPFVIIELLHGNIVKACLGIIIVATFSINAYSIYRAQRYYPKSLLLVFSPAVILYLGLSYWEGDIVGLLWCYPAILAFYFVLPEKSAWLANTTLVLTISPTIFYGHELVEAARIFGTLLVVSFLSGFFINIINKQNEKLHRMASTDPLTSLANRKNLSSDLMEAIELAKSHSISASLILVDIDHFKLINDNYGHDAGDKVLVMVSDVLRQSIRRSDRAYRIGGEEFLLLCHQTNEQNASELAESLRKAISRLTFHDDIAVTASFGIAEWQSDESWQDWFNRVDMCLYKAKDAGRNCCVSSSVN